MKYVAQKSFRQFFAWAWALFSDQLGDQWEGQALLLPSKPTTYPTEEVLLMTPEIVMPEADLTIFTGR
jgi:hypothetical protein